MNSISFYNRIVTKVFHFWSTTWSIASYYIGQGLSWSHFSLYPICFDLFEPTQLVENKIYVRLSLTRVYVKNEKLRFCAIIIAPSSNSLLCFMLNDSFATARHQKKYIWVNYTIKNPFNSDLSLARIKIFSAKSRKFMLGNLEMMFWVYLAWSWSSPSHESSDFVRCWMWIDEMSN